MMTTTLLPGSRLGGLTKWARTLALGLGAALGAVPFGAKAQLVLDSATPKTETFDGLGTSATATVPTGFKLSAEAAPTYNSANNYTATTAVANGNNFTAGGTYNFGAGTGSSDRALGFLTSSSYVTPRHILLAVSNTSGRTVQDLSVQFSLEKYRSGSREFNWTFWTSTDGVNWTAQAAGAQNYPADATNTVYSYPPLTATKTVALTGLNLASGATYYLRWTQQGTSGSTNGQAAGLDDVTLTPTLGGATTPTPAPTPTITTGSVSPTSFCVTSANGGAAFSVPFTTTGTLGGTYSVQLSDASGAFANTTSNLIGSGSSSPLSASIPAGTASGTGYRVRVLNSSPATSGTDNGDNLTVTLAAATNPVTVSPGTAQSVTTTGTGATLTATATLSGSAFAWQYGTSASGPYTALAGATSSTYQVQGAAFPGVGTYYVVAQATATTACGTVVGTSDPVTVTVTAPAATPTITVSDASLADFGSVAAGAASSLKDFTVEGTGLSGNLTITPPAGFEIRLEGGAFACCPIVLTPSGGTVSLTTIEVRFVPTAARAYAANITVEGSGQPTQTVAVTGTGVGAAYPATLSTATIAGITGATATSGGTIAADTSAAVTARGVVWSKTTNPTVLLTTKTTDGAGAGTFASTITGLVPGTTYYVRAYATNSVGTTYGNELTFTTTAVPLAAEPASQATIAQGTLGSTSVQLLLGGGPSQKRLVLARLSSAVDATPTDATTYTANPAFGSGQVLNTNNYVVYNGTGSEVTVTGLRPGSSYYFTVFAFNDNDTPYAENYLTTTPGTLTVNTPAAAAALLLEENFDYTAGSLLTANNWTAHSGAGSNSVAVVAANLSQAGYGPNSGNAAALTGNGEDVNRQFTPALYARTPVYASFLVQVNSASTTADYFFHLGPQTIGTTFRARVFVRRNATTGKVQFGTSSGTGTVSYASTEYDLGSTNLLVVKYIFDETSNSSQLFINPSTDTEPATADATATETGTTPAAPNNNIGSVALRQGTNAPNLVFDGLRVGTTFGAVKTGLTCSAPTAVAVSQITTTTASVSFTASSTATGDYTVTYTPSGGTAQTVTASASPVTLTGLVPNTAYAVTVSSQCTGGQTTTTTAVSFTTLGLRAPENPSNTVSGLNYQYYEAAGSYTKLPDFASSTPLQTSTTTGFEVKSLRQRDYAYALKYTGYVTVPTDGQYTFYTSSDDGSQLFIGSTLVVDNDGEHGLQEKAGTIGLQAGTHAITITYFQSGGGENLLVSYEGPNLAKQALPAASLRRVPSPTLRVPENPAGTVAGLNYQYYEAAGSYTKLPDFASSTPLKAGAATSFDVKSLRQRDYAYALKYTGYVTVPTDGQYTFYTSSDDGSQLFIGSTLVVDNDGEHGLQEKAGTIGLQAGTHAITITYFQSGGGENLLVSYEGPSIAKQLIPAASLSRMSASAARLAGSSASADASVASAELRLQAYPNPCTTEANLSFSLPTAGAYTLAVYDATGRLVETLPGNTAAAGEAQQLTLHTEHYQAGLYVVRLSTTTGTYQLRIVKK